MSLQQGKWRVPSWRSSQFLGKVQGRGPLEVEEPTQLRWIFPPECKTSVEKKRVSRAVRQEKEIY